MVSEMPTQMQSPESFSARSDSLAGLQSNFRLTDLPESRCPAPDCGAYMSRGFRMPNGDLVYQHTWRCRKFAAWNAAVERRREMSDLLASTLRLGGVPALPPPPDGVQPFTSLADYAEKTGASDRGSPHYAAWFYCERFASYVARNGSVPRSGFGIRGASEGGIGCGKTTLLTLTVRAAVEALLSSRKRASVVWYNCVSLARETHAAIRNGRLDELIREAIHTPLLILDDLGAEDPSPHLINQVFYEIVNERYHSDRPRPILYSTKYQLETLKERWMSAQSMRGTKADDANAVISRLGDMGHCVPIDCPDLRGPKRPDFLQ